MMTNKRDAAFFLDDYAGFLKKSIAFLSGRIRQALIPCLFIVLIATAAGFAWWYYQPPYFQSDLVCGYNNERISRKTYGEMINKLDLLARSGSYQELSRTLGIPADQAGSVISITASNMAGSPLQEDITNSYQAMYFTLKARSRDVFAPFQQSLIRYLNNSAYSKEIGGLLLAKNLEKIRYLNQDLRMTDSMLAAYTAALNNGHISSSDTTQKTGITPIFNYREQLEDKITNLAFRIGLDTAVTVTALHGFMPADKPARESKKVILAAMIAGLFVAFCYALLRKNKQEGNA